MHGSRGLRGVFLLSMAAGVTSMGGPVGAAPTVKVTPDIEYVRVAGQPLTLDLYQPAAGRRAAARLAARRRLGSGLEIADAVDGPRRARLCHRESRLPPGLRSAIPGPGARDQGRDPVPARGRSAIRLRRQPYRDSRRLLGRAPRRARRDDQRPGRARGHPRRPPDRVLRGPGHRLVFRRFELDHDPRSVHAVRSAHPDAGAAAAARRAARGGRGRRAAREPRVPGGRDRPAAADAARRPGPADADQPVTRARRGSTSASGSSRN